MFSPMLCLPGSCVQTIFYQTRASRGVNLQFFCIRNKSLASESYRHGHADRVSLLKLTSHYVGHFGETVRWHANCFALNVQFSLSRVRTKNVLDVRAIFAELLL